MVRSEPVRSVIVPDATLLTIGILKISAVGMSGAVTATTTVATAVPERFACTSRVVSTGCDPVGSFGTHEPRPSTNTSTRATAPVALGTDRNRRGPSGSSKRGGYRGNPSTRPRHQPRRVYGGDAGVGGRPGDARGRGIPVPVLDQRC